MTHNGIIDGKRRVSNSEIEAYRCPRKWWLEWYRGLRFTTEAPTEKRHSGDRVHRALAPWYVPDGVVRADPRETLERVILEDRGALTAHLTASGQDPEFSDELSKLIKLNDTERLMVAGYMEWLEETGEDANLEVVAAETYVEAPFPVGGSWYGYVVFLVGKIDVRVRRRSDGVRQFIDHKTVDTVPQYDELQRNPQMKHYHLLEDLSEDDGTRCDGALYNILRRVKRTARAKPPFYARTAIPHNPPTRDAFRRRTLRRVSEILRTEQELDAGAHHLDTVPPAPDKDCSWKCQFAAVCTMFDDGSRVEAMLDQHYTAGDPLHYYGDLLHSTND